jgi:hypothetical protein
VQLAKYLRYYIIELAMSKYVNMNQMRYFTDGLAMIAECVKNGQWLQSNVFKNQTIPELSWNHCPPFLVGPFHGIKDFPALFVVFMA